MEMYKHSVLRTDTKSEAIEINIKRSEINIKLGDMKKSVDNKVIQSIPDCLANLGTFEQKADRQSIKQQERQLFLKSSY